MTEPVVSILLPVYNGEKTLKATIESLLKQTYSNFELLIGIDGTHDGSEAIAKGFSDNRINIINNATNLGLANNVNKLIGLMHPKSQFFAMAEQDDVYVKERLQWQIDVFRAKPEVGLVSGIVEFQGDGMSVMFPGLLVKGKQFPQGEALFKYLYVNQLKVVNTCMMVQRNVHETHKLTFKNTYGNFNVDWDYVLRFSLVSNVYGIPKKLATMNRSLHNMSVTRDKTPQHKASRQLLKDFKREFPELISKKDYYKALKMHRKIELGHHTRTGIFLRCCYYYLLYFDRYFLIYLQRRIFKFFNKEVGN